MKDKYILGIVGLGYVGLPLCLAFGQKYKTFGFDISKEKINSYIDNIDLANEVTRLEFKKAKYVQFSNEEKILKGVNIFIVSVPTPVDKSNVPDLSALKNSCKLIGKFLKKDSIVIFEPTVFPGATEEICVPILEKTSNLKWFKDFNVAYSPERINPGDKERKLTKITKVISADTNKTMKIVSELYCSIIEAGVVKASSIKVAEAAKVIENTQRDLNIALMNEFAMTFKYLNIDTKDVLDIASTKWNFLKFKPGLVGGHCIGVDPYYLTYKAEREGYHPHLILAGRRVNDGMAGFICKEVIKKIISLKKNIHETKLLILGISFKENCSDLRNSKVMDLINELTEFGCNISIHDPLVNKVEAKKFGYKLSDWDKIKQQDVIIAAVSHEFYLKMKPLKILKKMKKFGLFVDIKSAYSKKEIIKSGFRYWSL